MYKYIYIYIEIHIYISRYIYIYPLSLYIYRSLYISIYDLEIVFTSANLHTKFMCTYPLHSKHTNIHTYVVPTYTTYIDLHLNMHMFIRTKTMCRRIPRHTLHVPYTSNLDSNIDRNMNRSSLDEYLQVWISRPHNTHIHLHPYIHTSHSYMHANTPKIEI